MCVKCREGVYMFDGEYKCNTRGFSARTPTFYTNSRVNSNSTAVKSTPIHAGSDSLLFGPAMGGREKDLTLNMRSITVDVVLHEDNAGEHDNTVNWWHAEMNHKYASRMQNRIHLLLCK